MCTDRVHILPHARQLGVGEMGVDGPVADRVDRRGSFAFLGLGDQVMVLNLAAKWPFTQPARTRLLAHRWRVDASMRPSHHRIRPPATMMAAPASVARSGKLPNTSQPSADAVTSWI